MCFYMSEKDMKNVKQNEANFIVDFFGGMLHWSRGNSKFPTTRLKRTESYGIKDREQLRQAGRNRIIEKGQPGWCLERQSAYTKDEQGRERNWVSCV